MRDLRNPAPSVNPAPSRPSTTADLAFRLRNALCEAAALTDAAADVLGALPAAAVDEEHERLQALTVAIARALREAFRAADAQSAAVAEPAALR